MDLFRRGERERAFGELVKSYSERLYWHVRTLVGNHDDADDILQDVFTKVWQGLSGFRAEAGLFTWIWRIATNEAISFLRRHRDSEEVPLDAIQPGGDIDPVKAQSLLHQAIAQLPPKQRAVFSLRYFEELPYDQIARITGSGQASLRASYHFAETKVREFILSHADFLTRD